MHEAALMHRVLEEVERHARMQTQGRVRVVRLRVGRLSGVVPDALEFAFAALKRGTLAEEAHLDIVSVAARARCQSCGGEFELEDPLTSCPACGGWAGDLLQGRELELWQLELG